MSTADPTPVGTIRPLDAGLPVETVMDDDELGGREPPVRRPPRSRRPWRRRIVLAAVLVVVAVFGYFLVSVYQVWSTGRSNEARPVDAIVVLGAAQYDGTPSPQLAARLDEVVRLWPEGHAPLVVTTGGSQPGDRFTEADASAAYLIERGIPDDAILREDEGTTTYESLAAVSNLLDERSLDTVLVVTDPYHALRSRLIAEDVGLTAYVSPTTSSVVGTGSAWKHNVEEAAGIMVGRIIGFEHL